MIIKQLVVAFSAVVAAVYMGSARAAAVPVDAPALVLKGRTLADVQTNEISGNAIGRHMRPRNMVGFNKAMLSAAAGQPRRLRVEMQMMDSYHLKCIVLELFDGAGGVQGRAVTASVQQQVVALPRPRQARPLPQRAGRPLASCGRGTRHLDKRGIRGREGR